MKHPPSDSRCESRFNAPRIYKENWRPHGEASGEIRGRVHSDDNSANRKKKKNPSVVWFVYVETWGRAKKQMTEADS